MGGGVGGGVGGEIGGAVVGGRVVGAGVGATVALVTGAAVVGAGVGGGVVVVTDVGSGIVATGAVGATVGDVRTGAVGAAAVSAVSDVSSTVPGTGRPVMRGTSASRSVVSRALPHAVSTTSSAASDAARPAGRRGAVDGLTGPVSILLLPRSRHPSPRGRPYTAPVPPSRRTLRAPIAATALTLLLAAGAAACSDDDGDGAAGFRAVGSTFAAAAPDSASESSTPESTGPVSSRPTTTRPARTTTTSTTTSTSTSTTTTTIDPLTVAHAFPVDPEVGSSYTPEAHSNYRATDVFATAGCGTRLLAPVTGTVDEVLENVYDRATDNPADRGGNAVSIIGDDGVRYYMAHFQAIDPSITPGARVTAGQFLGEMGDTGRAGACHVHFGLSLPCPEGSDDWYIRRGVIWPDVYLDSWKAGENLSPLTELEEWFAEYPDACRSLEDTPYPRG